MLSTREWRRNRDREGILLGLVYRAGKTTEAWRVYREWANAEITYEEARKRLLELARKANRPGAGSRNS